MARFLGLVATPVFGVMAVVCALEPHRHATGSPLGSMWLMYLLMASFHAGPWLDRGGWRSSPPRSGERRRA